MYYLPRYHNKDFSRYLGVELYFGAVGAVGFNIALKRYFAPVYLGA
jgi:hypothetical protein